MASEYNLRLKAVLDTSDVQQKLNQLRNTQKQALNGSQPGQAAAPNLGNLASVLNRLNSTLMQLQNSINRLNSVNVNTRNGSSNYIPLGPLGPIRHVSSSRRPSNLSDTASTINSAIRDFQQIRRDLGALNGLGNSIRDITRLRNNPSVRNWRTAMDYADNGFAWAESLESQFGRSGNRAFGRSIRGFSAGMAAAPYAAGAYDIYGFGGSRMRPTIANVNQPINPELRRALRWGGGLAAHQIMGGVQSYFQTTGNTTGSALMGIGQNAAIGGMIGGPIGVGLGAAVGALSESFKILTDRTKALADAIASQESRVKEAGAVKIALQDQLIQKNDERRLKIGDTQYFQKQLSVTQGRIDRMRKYNEQVGTDPESLEKYEKETLRQINAFRAGSPTGELPEYIKNRQNIADQYRKNLSEIDKATKRAEGYKTTLEGFGIYQDEDKQETYDFGKNIGRKSTSVLKGIRSIATEELSDAIDKRKRLMERGAPLEQIEGVQKEIDTFRERLGILNEEMEKRNKRIKDINRTQIEKDIDSMQSRLSTMKAPDMTAVTSLASQGFAISKKDDEIRIRQEQNYQAEQTKLQRDIRNKIMELDSLNSSSYQ